MNKGAGPYPHHAWWQVGLLTDYLVSEVSLRSNNAIRFPKGFVTPKVGPHTCYGFAPGQLFGKQVDLYMPDGWLHVNNPQVDYLSAKSNSGDQAYILLLNNDDAPQQTLVKVNEGKPSFVKATSVKLLNAAGTVEDEKLSGNQWSVNIPPYGLKIIALSL